MNPFTRFPLRLTIPCFLILLAILAEVFVLMYNLRLADAEEEKEALALVTQEMTQLQDNIGSRLRREDREGIESAIATTGASPNVALVVLVDDAGTVINSTSLKLIGVPIGQALPDVDTVMLKEAGKTLTGRVFLYGDKRFISAYYPVILGAKTGETRPHRVGVLYLRYDLALPKAIRRHGLERQAIVMAGFYAGCFLLLGLFLHLILARRIGRLVSVIRRFACGDFSAQTRLEGRDELAQIGVAFDQMAGETARNIEVQRRLNRELRAISNCNQTLMRADDEQTLLNAICNIVCNEAGYRMAWVGYAERDEDRTIRIAARAGVENGYIEQARLTWADTERGRGPAGIAIRSGQSACIQDFATEPKAAPWRDMALERGYRSVITLPLKDGSDNTFGILTIYSTEPNAFTPEEIRLLEELAGDLAFGIVTIRSRAERRLLESQKDQYLRFFMLSSEAMCIADPFGCFKQVNPALAQLTGYSESELVAKPFLDFVHQEDRQRTADEMKLQVAVRPSMQFENRYVCKDGSVILLSWTAYFDKGDGVTYATARDITESRKLEEAIAANEKEFRLLAEAMPQIVWVTRPDGWNTYFNQQWVEYTGLALEESYGHGWNKPFHPDDQQRAWDAWQNALNNNGIYSLECRLRRADGVYRWWLIRGVPVSDEHGKIYKWFGTCTDINDIKQAENELRNITSYTRSLIEASLDPLVTINSTGKITDVNEATVQATGEAREALIGRDFAEFFTEPDKASEGYQQVFANGLVTDYPLTLRHRDGRVIDVLYNASVYRNEAGEVLGVFAAARDVTERKKAEQDVAQLSLRNKLILESAGEGIYGLDLDGRCTFVNPSALQLLGFTVEELVGQHCHPVFHHTRPDGSPYPVEECPVQSAYKQGGVHRGEDLYWRKDGNCFPVEFISTPIREAGKITGAVVTFTDITERKQAEEALRNSEERLKEAQHLANIGNWDLDPATGTLTCSEEFYRIFGHDQAQPLPKYEDQLKAFTAESAARADAAVKRNVQTGEPYELDLELVRTEGTHRWLTTRSETKRDAKGRITGLRGTVQDITERKQAALALERANRALRTLSASNMALVHADSEAKLLDTICQLIVETGGYRMAWVGFAAQDAEKTVCPMAHYGHEDGFLAEAKISWADSELGRGPTGTAIRSGAIQVNMNFMTNPAMAPWQGAASRLGYQSSIALPLKSSAGTLGALTIYASVPDAFNETEVTLLKELADDLAFGIGTLRLHADRDRIAYEQQHHEEILRRSLEQSIQAIADTVEARDSYTAGHQRRVAELAAAIAREMGLAEERIHGIRLAASVHDLGKIQVPAEILAKPGKLTGIEYMLIKTHPEAGYDILKDIEFPWPIADMVRQHHERLDGSGYPQGLKGGDILFESRILTVADVVEAMASHRPYRPALGIDRALMEIERGRSSSYDPAVADACIQLFREGRFAFSE